MHYRLYILNEEGRISGAIDLEGCDDGHAWDQALRLLANVAVEMWQGARCVGRRRLGPEPTVWQAVEVPKLLRARTPGVALVPKMARH